VATAEWQAWAARHKTIFALTTDGDAAMLLEWCDLFARQGFAPAELHAATEALAVAPPRFRADHLAGLQAAVRDSRRILAAKPPPDRGTCETCGGAGLAEVPLSGLAMRFKRGGETVVGTYPDGTLGVVLCHCPLGRWLKGNGHAALGWEDFEAQKPDWKEELAEIKALRKARLRASGRAADLDRALGEVLRRATAKAAPRPQLGFSGAARSGK
jgi:hypothetical protein